MGMKSISTVATLIFLFPFCGLAQNGGGFTMAQTLSDGAQRSTLAFDGLAMMTGNLEAQSFFPPGKVADYAGFQYLRDNDPDNMGHNTSFLTRIAYNVIYLLNDDQFNQLKTLATAQLDQINLYAYKRYSLMQAFRRLLDGDIPADYVGLSLAAVKQASRELYLLDGQISFDRALLYANIINSLDATQRDYLDSMKGHGWNSWPDITSDQVRPRMQGLPQDTAVAVMTYAGDLFSWYAGSLEADVYFCPERQGTYYGGFYIKDAPAIGHEGYSIDEQLTATAGAALCDSSKGYVSPAQAAAVSTLVDLQRNNLYAGLTNIVGVRTQIATLLRSLLVAPASSNAVEAEVLDLSSIYGDLDGENNYFYATVFARVFQTLDSNQKTNLMELRHSIMSGTYADGTPFDFTICTTPFLYSAVITNLSLLAPYTNDTDYLFLRETTEPPFDIILGHPTDRSIAISVLATNDLEAFCEYGLDPDMAAGQSAWINLSANIPDFITLDGLQENQRYYYHVVFRNPDETNFSATVSRTFHTRRAETNSFTFAIEADPHHLDNDPAVWRVALSNLLADTPDFLIDLGDTFMDEKVGATTYEEVAQLRRDVRTGFFGLVGHSVPLFLVNGNHDAELGWLLDGTTNNLAGWGAAARNEFYPSPQPDGFYSGRTETEPPLPGPRDGYYAFQWGGALFVMLDPFWFTSTKPGAGPDIWDWTLGTNQYEWLRETLSNSTAALKLVFIHHLVGGSFDGAGRGGLEFAQYGEWGGYNTNDTWGFDSHRPDWTMPIQNLLLSNGVDAVFHGHDHLFVKQDLDANGDGRADLVYQETPQPSRVNYNNTVDAANYGYTNGAILGNSGHLRVTVSSSNALVEYVRAFLPGDEGHGRTNGMVSYSYALPAPAPVESPFPGTIIPGRPTDHSLALNVLAATNLEAFFEFGPEPGVYTNQTSVTNLIASEPAVIDLYRLPPNARAFYRLRFKTAGDADFHADTERSFHTQRAPGTTFTFDIQSDSHIYDKKGSTSLYAIAESNILADRPDFLLDLGDTFGDDHTTTNITYAELDELHADQRLYFNIAGRAAPVFLCLGNHEGETIGYEVPDTNANPICTYATQARLRHCPNPFPDGFYSGNTNADVYVHTNRVAGLPGNYYAWEWGDALFVVLDAYRYLPMAKPTNLWDWTLGNAQYDWFRQTLEGSSKPYKFVFAHQVLGQVRGGAAWAGKYEWGGENKNGKWGFATNRPGWALPIQQLMATNHVTAFFHGHDHLFARENVGGVVYQELPTPSDATYHVGDTNADAYVGTVTNNSGHLRVTVAPWGVRVEYVRAYLPADEAPKHTNGMVDVVYYAAARDSVGDGIPDWWRAEHFGGNGNTTNEDSCATCDPDLDHFPNSSEQGAGTRPNDPDSVLGIVEPVWPTDASHPVVIWQGEFGKNYRLERSADLATDDFSTVVATDIPGEEPITTYTDTTATAAAAYYRIAVE